MIDADRWTIPNTIRRPPGMPWDDWHVWRPWLEIASEHWDAMAYDIELLTQPLPQAHYDPAILRSWMRVTAKRIDAVGRRGTQYDIFEARRTAGWSAIAQLLGYRDLWLMQFPHLQLRDLWLITESIDDATRATARRHGIRTWAVGEPLPT